MFRRELGIFLLLAPTLVQWEHLGRPLVHCTTVRMKVELIFMSFLSSIVPPRLFIPTLIALVLFPVGQLLNRLQGQGDQMDDELSL